jgi:hypothetical protein
MSGLGQTAGEIFITKILVGSAVAFNVDWGASIKGAELLASKPRPLKEGGYKNWGTGV